LSVVLTILKITGIVLLALLLLVVLLLGMIMLVPFRYQAGIHMDDETDGKAVVSYLLHIVHVSVRYEHKEKYGVVRIFGIPVIDLFPSEEKRKKKEEKRRKKEEKEKKKQQKLENKRKNKAKTKKYKNKHRNRNGQAGKGAISTGKESPSSTPQSKQNRHAEKEVGRDQSVVDEQTAEKRPCEEKTSEQRGVIQKIKDLIRKVMLFLQKAIDKVKNLKYTINSFLEKISRAKETVLWYLDVLTRDESKRAIGKCKQQLIRLLKWLKPRKFEGLVEFGMEDPGKTGDIYSKLCLMYPLYARCIVIIPNFEQKIMRGELFVKGKLRLVTLVSIAWKIVFDKDIRNLYNIVTGGAEHE